MFRKLSHIYLIYIVTVILILYTGGNQFINYQAGTFAVAITFNELYAFYQYISKFFNPIQAFFAAWVGFIAKVISACPAASASTGGKDSLSCFIVAL